MKKGTALLDYAPYGSGGKKQLRPRAYRQQRTKGKQAHEFGVLAERVYVTRQDGRKSW